MRTAVPGVLLGSLLVVLLTSGCGSDKASTDGGQSPKKPALSLAGVRPDGETVQTERVSIAGKVSVPGALVDVEGYTGRADSSGVFRVKVKLNVGDNFLDVTATKPGYQQAKTTIDIQRELSSAERKARAEAKRLKREAELAHLRATAKPLDPKLFDKNPDGFIGQSVVMRGQIFQIEEPGYGNFFLMTTECKTEYGSTFCDGPDVYVSYGFSTNKTTDDLVTVYGTVQGSFDYSTKIGGSNTVGHIKARIIE
jgi:hypothetical protein